MGLVNGSRQGVFGKFGSSIQKRGWLSTLSMIPKNIYFYVADFDHRYGTNTRRDFIDGPVARQGGGQQIPEDDTGYQGTWPRVFNRIMASLNVDYKDFVFMDLGSGKGKALLLSSHYPFKKIIGVEYDVRLHEIAKKRRRRASCG